MKREYPPLFSPGIKKITMEEIDFLLKEPFPKSAKREILFKQFCQLFSKLKELGIPLKIWIDGSFCTEKEEPNDIDIVIEIAEEIINSLPLDKQKQLDILLNNKINKVVYNCDTYYVASEKVHMLSYWRGWFGFCRDGETAKGFLVLEFNV
ncbi:DUF6932 family protein [Neisseria sp. Ec49-e6-T10]|uniref:DUF6932 family protein n=1 Tax=Neisseria sp. Ec49-e6-T10 TaxID=3140744 RepID=UPI003EB7D642